MVGADGIRLKVPTWAGTRVAKAGPPLWANIPDGARFYFVHSYYVDPADPAIAAATTDYGIPLPGR